MSGNTVKFFCDEQLGKLARWLRIIGVDAKFEPGIEDRDLVARAGAEGRIVLTRDTHLAGLAGPGRVVWLTENYPALQLREVVKMYSDRIEVRVFTRCPACNGEVEGVGKAEVEGLVPEFVWTSQERFTRCVDCKNIYWQATHRSRVEVQLRDILGDYYKTNEREQE
jgi:uncharacterized protein with PIN domain